MIEMATKQKIPYSLIRLSVVKDMVDIVDLSVRPAEIPIRIRRTARTTVPQVKL